MWKLLTILQSGALVTISFFDPPCLVTMCLLWYVLRIDNWNRPSTKRKIKISLKIMKGLNTLSDGIPRRHIHQWNSVFETRHNQFWRVHCFFLHEKFPVLYPLPSAIGHHPPTHTHTNTPLHMWKVLADDATANLLVDLYQFTVTWQNKTIAQRYIPTPFTTHSVSSVVTILFYKSSLFPFPRKYCLNLN